MSRQLWSVAARTVARRSFGTVAESTTATDGWQNSRTMEVLFSINDDEPVHNAVQMLATYDIGCLVTTGDDGTFQ